MICLECLAESYLVVDGKEMTKDEINQLPRAPRKIERKLNHEIWCTETRKIFTVKERFDVV